MRRALMTGGSGAIGAAVCRELAARGMRVIVHAHRNAERVRVMAGEIAAAGGAAEVVAFDVTDHAAAAAAVEGMLEAGEIQVNGGMA